RLDRNPDFFRVVLDPARLREVLRELDGGATERRSVLRDHERGRARRALIDGEEVFGHGRGISWNPWSSVATRRSESCVRSCLARASSRFTGRRALENPRSRARSRRTRKALSFAT